MRPSSGAAESRASRSCPRPAWTAVPLPLQEVAATASRRAEPRAWLRAVSWLVDSARLHPRACATTVAVARDLAARMDYTEGTVLYDLAGTARRCAVSTATVKRHVRVLRELGALAWVRHGSRRNLRLPGRSYAGTATVYAATVPARYDASRGHRLSGTGYGARVVGVTEGGRREAVRAVRRTGNPASRAGRSTVRAPQSPGLCPRVRKAEMDGGSNDTSRRRARRRTRSSTPAGDTERMRRSPWQVARDVTVARQVRPLVGWTQREGLRRLAYALRPLIDQGLDSHDIAAELHAWYLDWCPASPAAYITAQLRQRAVRGVPAAGHREVPNAEFRAAVARAAGGHTAEAGPCGVCEPLTIEGLSRAEVVDLRSAGAADPGLVRTAVDLLGEDEARRLYTHRLVRQALGTTRFAGSGSAYSRRSSVDFPAPLGPRGTARPWP
ncbi:MULTISPECIES: cell wall protein [unclassified Streptomyces]|uniref:cell wall protein n=1 Tax=unclassified Streptomyces TaxID=2593676 RepID=UPI0015E176A3|nr:cell wall protein [Streptomyces sp. SM10]